jgi:predicted metal-binding membrane protein
MGDVLDGVLRRDRQVVSASLVGIAGLAWLYVLHLGRGMSAAGEMRMAMPQMQSWGAVDLLLLFVMWAVMMIAMMVPSAAPMILLFATVDRRRRGEHQPYVATGVFLIGYLAVWSGFSAVATGAQWGLHRAALLSPMMVSSSAVLGGALLVAAGVFQWTPLKYACLTRCRSPLGFLLSEWREGLRGAFVMGLRHGAYCVGCCWALMTLLFVAGVMNLLWVAAIAAFVLVEKVIPHGQVVSRLTGVALVVAGVWVFALAYPTR